MRKNISEKVLELMGEDSYKNLSGALFIQFLVVQLRRLFN